jgi:uncharacterized membrane protein
MVTVVEATIVVAAITYTVTASLWALLAWEAVAVSYLLVGLAAVWQGSKAEAVSPRSAQALFRWAWVLPMASSLAGVNAAVMGLLASHASRADSASTGQLAAAAIGIIASWALLHVGFAQIYRAADAARESPGIAFPAQTPTAALDYLYFSFTIGSSFATSDAEVTALPVRRIVLVHSIVSFFYNALVVAVAFQVLQGLAQT